MEVVKLGAKLISYLLKLIGTSALLALIIIYASERADASPVRVEFSGHTTELLVDYPWDDIYQGNVAYEGELLREVPVGTPFVGSFTYDPGAPASASIPSPFLDGYGLEYDGLISSAEIRLQGASGVAFTNSNSTVPLTIFNDLPRFSDTYGDLFGVTFGELTPAFPGIPSASPISAAFYASENTLYDPLVRPDLLSSYEPPENLQFLQDFETVAVSFNMTTDQGSVYMFGALDVVQISPVPAPASIGLFLLGLGFVARRRWRA